MIEPLTQNEIEGADDVAAASEKDPHGLDQHQAALHLFTQGFGKS